MTTLNDSSQDTRIKSQMRVYYGQSQDTILTGFSVDLSTGGLFLTTDFPLDVGESLSLIFSLPDSDRAIRCKARVAWTNRRHEPRKPELPAGVGVQFIDMPLEDMKSLKLFLERNIIEPTW